MKTCSIADCNKNRYSRGWCRKHYERWRAHGDPSFTKQIRNDDLARFHSKYLVDETSGCWNWTGLMDARGYGRLDTGGRPKKAHRVGYELLVAPIGASLTIDHLCRNTRCVNPKHLELVTAQENLRRAHAARGYSSALSPLT